MEIAYVVVGLLALILLVVVVVIPSPKKEDLDKPIEKPTIPNITYRPNILYTNKTIEVVENKPVSDATEDITPVAPPTELELLIRLDKNVTTITTILIIEFAIATISILIALCALLG